MAYMNEQNTSTLTSPAVDPNHQVIANLLQVEASLGNLWISEIIERPLDLSYKQVNDIPESIVHRLKHYSTVVLSNTQISKFPKALVDFTNIITLDMSRCNMKELSPAIGNLVSLKYLILDHNELSYLPETIGKLTNLLELNVAFNKLRELPGTYGFLSSLKYLNISNNELTALPTEIGKLQNLEIIIGVHNQIREVNPSIGSMSKLWSINLSHNPLERVPSTLIKIIPRLTTMEFNNTPLYDHVFKSEENKNRFTSIAEYLFSLPTDIIVSKSTFTRDMRNILNGPLFSDMKLKHHGQVYHGHRCVVSARVHRVKAELLWNEANISDIMNTKDCVITVKDSVPTNVFEAVLAYLYVADVANFETIQEYITDTVRGSQAEEMLSMDLAALRKSATFSDISFTVDSKEVKGHKCILAATCKTLSTFFTGEWKEARESTATLGGFSNEAVELFFDYLYAGDCEVTGDNVMEMLAIADVFHVDRLKERCEQLLVEGIDDENLMLIYEAAERHNALQLIENCAFYASKNCSPEALKTLPQKLHQVAEELKTRTKKLRDEMQRKCGKSSVVFQNEAEQLQAQSELHKHWAPTLQNSSEWGKIKGYNIQDPSEVLPSGKEETEKFLADVLKKLNEPTPTNNDNIQWGLASPWQQYYHPPPAKKTKVVNGVEFDKENITHEGFFGGIGETPNMGVLTLGGNAITDIPLEEPQVDIDVPNISLNDNPFKVTRDEDREYDRSESDDDDDDYHYDRTLGIVKRPPPKSPFSFGDEFVANTSPIAFSFSSNNNQLAPSTSPGATSMSSGFDFSFNSASPNKPDASTSPSMSPSTGGFAFGTSPSSSPFNTPTKKNKTPFTGEFTLDGESSTDKHNTDPSTPVFGGGVTFNAGSNNNNTSTSPSTVSGAFDFSFSSSEANKNTLSTSPSAPSVFGFSFGASPSQSGLSANNTRTRSPNKSGRKSSKRDQQTNEGIFGDNEKEKSVEQLLTRLNFKE